MLLAAQASSQRWGRCFSLLNDTACSGWLTADGRMSSDVKQQMVVWFVPTTIARDWRGTGVALTNRHRFRRQFSYSIRYCRDCTFWRAIMLWVRWQAQGIKDKLL